MYQNAEKYAYITPAPPPGRGSTRRRSEVNTSIETATDLVLAEVSRMLRLCDEAGAPSMSPTRSGATPAGASIRRRRSCAGRSPDITTASTAPQRPASGREARP